jgi:hypothetical protein
MTTDQPIIHALPDQFAKALAQAVATLGDDRANADLRLVYVAGWIEDTHPEIADLLRAIVYPTRKFPGRS